MTTALATPAQTPLGQMVQSRRAAAGARSDSGFALLSSVELAYGARLSLIEAAQKTLDLQYYAIHADSSTEKLLMRLREAARRGVRVRILLDDFNTAGRNAQVLRLGYENNIEMRLFNPLPGSRRSLAGRILGSIGEIDLIQQRMHNKLFIADNVLGITGGRNLGDSYFGQDGGSNFVDLDILAAGRIVADMSASFDRYWNNELAYPVQSLISQKDLDALVKPLPAPTAGEGTATMALPALPASPAVPLAGSSASVLPDATPTVALANTAIDLRRTTLTWAPATLMVDKPGKIGPDDDEVAAQDTLIDGLLQLMAQTKNEAVIISPYFVPGQPMMKVFGEMRARGVRIRVLTNSLASNDAPAAHAGYARYRRDLINMGVELYELRSEQSGEANALGSSGSSGSSRSGDSGAASSSRASLHAKALVMDGRLIVIGSMNLDLRSQLQNTEVALVIRSSTLSREAVRQVDTTLRNDAYRVELSQGELVWRAPPGARFADSTTEPDSSVKLRMLIKLISPFAPDELL
ncbi:MAG: phospholipase D family protein [Pseudomonadota bacterium]